MIYDFKVKDIEGEEISLKDYKGKVLLIVNTATGCGFTPQYEALEALYKKYKDKGFEILDFPCNQFFEQAPESDEEIQNFCKVNFGTTFKTFKKVKVNGEEACELYKFLKKEAPMAKEDKDSLEFYNKLESLGFKTEGEEIKWNFTKFLIDKRGDVVARFAPTFEPKNLEKIIEELLAE